jgi:rhomboid protease GluP
MTGLSVAILAIRLTRTPWTLSRDWWPTMLVVVIIGAVAHLRAPDLGGYVAFGAMLLLVVAPLRLDRAAQLASRAGKDQQAQRLAGIARLFHPFGLVGKRGRTLEMYARVAAGAKLDETTLEGLGAKGDPLLTEWYRLNALHSAGDAQGVRASLALPSRRHRMLQLGFGPAWVRAVAVTGTFADVIDAVVEAEKHDRTLSDPSRRALLALEACAALGDVEATRAIGDLLGERLPRGLAAWSVATAQRAAGDSKGATETIDRALADQAIHPRARRLLDGLREKTQTDSQEPAPFGRRSEADSLVARLRREVIVSDALSPLTGTSTAVPRLTYGIAGILVAVFLFVEATGSSTNDAHLRESGGLVLPMHGLESVPQLFTSSLLHAGVLHLAFNLIALVMFGRFVESFYGRARTIAIWLVATVTSGLTAATFGTSREGTILVGASGAIFGLGGALIAALLVRPDLRGSRQGRAELSRFGLLFALQIALDAMLPMVSGSAHIGGMIGGAIVGAIVAPRARATR